MTSSFIVIPTRFDRATLPPLVESCIQVAETVVVHTEPGHAPIRGTIPVQDYSPSIQHWWNSGLDLCTGPTLVLNDDIYATPDDLLTLLAALDDADVVYLAGHRIGHVTPLTGWCYGIRPDVIRPSNDFLWWYGEDDLYRRALRDGLRVVAVDLPGIEHRRAEVAFANPTHAAMVEQDGRLYAERWP
jgi:pimeloyl-ACP methyl ester carboxylesterase